MPPETFLSVSFNIPPIGFGVAKFGKRIRQFSKESQKALGDAGHVSEETLSGLRTVRSFAQEDYEKNLNDLNKITIKESYEEIDMAMKSSTVNKFIQLKKLDISLMNLKTDNVKLWKDIQNFYSKKEMRSAENDFPNFENIFGKATVNKIEYIDANSIILFSKDAFDHPFYTTLVKTTIKGKDIILATKNIESSVLSKETSKEMAYFYKTLFNHFGKI